VIQLYQDVVAPLRLYNNRLDLSGLGFFIKFGELTMARSRLTATPNHDVSTDSGPVLLSLTEAEKYMLQIDLNATQFADITNMSVCAAVVEGTNDGEGTKPASVLNGATAVECPIIMPPNSFWLGKGGTANNLEPNQFRVYFDAEEILSTWSTQPSVGKPVYGFLSVVIDELADDSETSFQQHFELLRGQIEFVKSIC